MGLHAFVGQRRAVDQLHRAGDDRAQLRLKHFFGRRGQLHEFRRPVSAAPVHAVQHQAVQVDVQVGGLPEALDQRDRAAVERVGRFDISAGLPSQMACDHGVRHLQPKRQQLGLRGQQQAQRDG